MKFPKLGDCCECPMAPECSRDSWDRIGRASLGSVPTSPHHTGLAHMTEELWCPLDMDNWKLGRILQNISTGARDQA